MPLQLHFGRTNSFLISLISNSRMTFVKCDEKGQILDIAFKVNGSIFKSFIVALQKQPIHDYTFVATFYFSRITTSNQGALRKRSDDNKREGIRGEGPKN